MGVDRDISASLGEAIGRVDHVQSLLTNGELGAVALVTDDSLESLGLMAATRDWLSEHGSLEWWPPNYPYEDNSDAMDTTWDLIEQRRAALEADGLALGEVTRLLFEILLDGLACWKESNQVPDDVLVFAASSDPGQSMLELATRGVERLNEPAAIVRWRWNWRMRLSGP